MKNIKFLFVVAVAAILWSCGGKEFHKNPVDILIKDMTHDSAFSIILYDMNVQGSVFKDYYHKYRIIKNENGEPVEKFTDWYEVNKSFFYRHENHMGMEIASKTPDGTVKKSAAPPGYSSYVGNSRYGHWVNRNGSSFWEFYGKYAMLSSMFNMMSFPVRRSYYDTYRQDYYGTGRTYYGPKTASGRKMYGTYGDYSAKTRANSKYRSSSTFKNRVRSGVSRSSGTSRYSGTKRSRSGSRYSSGSGYRSRSGGFGK